MIHSYLRQGLLRLGQWCVRLSLDPQLRRDLALVYDRLDGQMPRLLRDATPVEMTVTIGKAIAEVTEQKPTGQKIAAIAALYNPIVATVRNLKR